MEGNSVSDDSESASLIIAVFTVVDTFAGSWDSKLWKDGCCVPISDSRVSDLTNADSVSDDSESRSLIGVVFDFAVVDASLVSETSDLMEAESVSDGSESWLLSVVFTVVESLAGLMVTEMGKNISGTPGLFSVSSDLMGGECVSDESESVSLSVVVFFLVDSLAILGETEFEETESGISFAGMGVLELGTDGSTVPVLVSSVFDLIGGDTFSADSESGSNIVVFFVTVDVDALSINEFLTPVFCVDGENEPFISSSSPPLILLDHSNRNINI